jgi:CzcA family heavy metal efflux pump
MLSALIQFCVERARLVGALILLLAAAAVSELTHSQVDVFPSFVPPQVTIQTEAPGFAPEEVEQLVTRPVETVLQSTPGVHTVRSQSIQGLSVINVIFEDRTELLQARQLLSERIPELARRLPAEARTPVLAPLSSPTGVVLVCGLTSRTRTLETMRTLADWTMRPHLQAVPGVARVTVFGGEIRQLQVQVQPQRMASLGISLAQVIATGRVSTGIRGAGFVESAAQRVPLQTQGQTLTPEALGHSLIQLQGDTRIQLQDIAKVAWGAEPRIGAALIQGEPGVILVIQSHLHSSLLDVNASVEEALDQLEPELKAEGIQLHRDLFRPADFIHRAVRSMAESLLIGSLLVALVLMAFLRLGRLALISLAAIPLSLLAAAVLLQKLGYSLNTLTLGGLAIAIGEVVDDAIIDVENIYRRLRLRQPEDDLTEVIRAASYEVRASVLHATAIVILVFSPILALTGVAGKLFIPLAVAYILAILASLLVALTLTPALCRLWLADSRQTAEAGFLQSWKASYRRRLNRICARPGPWIGGVLCLLTISLGLAFGFGGSFLPDLKEGHLILHLSSLPGTSLDQSLALGKIVTRELKELPQVRCVSERVGRAELSEDTWGSHYAEFDIDFKPLSGEEMEAVQAEISERLEKLPGVTFSLKPFLTERIEESMTGSTADVIVKLFGEDLDLLDSQIQVLAQRVRAIPGAEDVQIETPPGAPRLVIQLRPDRLLQFGIHGLEVLDAVQAAYQGLPVAQLSIQNRLLDVTVNLPPALRDDLESVGNLPIGTPRGWPVALKNLANLKSQAGRYAIVHEGGQRRAAVTCNVRGRDVRSFTNELKTRLDGLDAGVYAVVEGAAEARQRAQNQLIQRSLLAALAIILILATAVGHWRNLLLLLCNLPFALMGGVLAVSLTGSSLSLGSLVGFITLFGITMRNSILLLNHYEHLVHQEKHSWNLQTALMGAEERFTPILMTALITGLGLLPIAWGSGEPGREVEGPMAIVILGGLLSSTFLNLYLMPALALRFGRFQEVVP